MSHAGQARETKMAKLDMITKRICPPERTRAADLGLLALRLTAGGLIAGHGAQKLFGAFGGQGFAATAGSLEAGGMRPGKFWAAMAGLSEFGGGSLTALGFLHPLGSILFQGSMATAIRKVHWGKPIWATEGGGELPLVYSTIGIAFGLAGPGRYSLDRVLGFTVPRTVTALAAGAVVAGIMIANRPKEEEQPEQASADEAAMEEPESGEDRIVETQPAPASSSDQGRPQGEAETMGTSESQAAAGPEHS